MEEVSVIVAYSFYFFNTKLTKLLSIPKIWKRCLKLYQCSWVEIGLLTLEAINKNDCLSLLFN